MARKDLSVLALLLAACSGAKSVTLGGADVGGAGATGGSGGGSSAGSAAAGAEAMLPEDLDPSAIATGCAAQTFVMPAAAEPGMLSQWLELSEVDAARAVVALGSKLFVLSSREVIRIDLDDETLCTLSGFPSRLDHADLVLSSAGRLILSSSEGARAVSYRSDDEGATWNASEQPPVADEGTGAARLVVDPASDRLFAVAGASLDQSLDNGETWEALIAEEAVVSSKGGAAVDRSGATLLYAFSDSFGRCSPLSLQLSDGAAGEWRSAGMQSDLPCGDAVADLHEDNAFYLLGSGRLSHVSFSADGNMSEDRAFVDASIVVNALWVDDEVPGRLLFTGLSGTTLAAFESLDWGVTATPLETEEAPSLIGSAIAALPNDLGISFWAFRESAAPAPATIGFVLP